MSDLTLQHVVLRICAAALILAVHGGAVAGTAHLLGDPGPRDDGRVGIGLLRHLDVVGGLLLVLFTYGWISPVAVDPERLRPGRGGLVVVVAVASCATLALAVLLQSIRPPLLNMLPDTAAATFFIFVQTVGQLSVSFTLFNLLPLLPLTGRHLLVALLPRQQPALRHVQPYVVALLALLVVAGVVDRILAPAETVLRQLLSGGS